jgi:putative phosphoesterase
MTIKVAIVSDTHAHLDARIADVVKDCDYAIHAGDICGENILESLESLTGNLIAVAGNNDPYCHEKQLPDVSTLDLPGGQLAIEHGHVHGMAKPCHDSLRKAHSNARVIIYGHTHKQIIDKSSMPWVINPGAAGQTRTNGGPSCLILEVSGEKLEQWQITPYRFSEKNTE